MNHKPLWDVEIDSNSYRVFSTVEQLNTLELVEMFSDGKSASEKWRPINLILYEGGGEDEERIEYDKSIEITRPIADFMSGFIEPTISLRTMSIMKPMIKKHVELLPVNTEIGEYFVLNVKWIDCLDANLSIVERFHSSGRIMRVLKYSFHWDQLENVPIFRIKELGHSRLFVSDIFKQEYEKNNLTGLIFYPVPLVE